MALLKRIRFKLPLFSRRLNLASRLVIYILAVAGVPIIMLAVLSFQDGSQGIRSHVGSHLSSVAIVKAQEVERWFRPLESSARALASTPLVREHVRTLLANPESAPHAQEEARQSLRDAFEEVIHRNIGVRGMAAVAAGDGVVLASTGLNPVSSMAPGPSPHLEGSSVGTHLDPFTKDRPVPYATIEAPLVLGEETDAYIVLLASANHLYEVMAPTTGLGPGSKVYLVDQDGVVLTPPPMLREGPGVLHSDALLETSGGAAATGLLYEDFRGEEVVAAYQPIPGVGWGVAAELPASQAFESINTMRLSLVGSSGLFLLLILLATLLITRRVSQPLRTLMSGAQTIGEGNLHHRIYIRGSDETAMLAQSFNQMASNLQTSQARVRAVERTAALQTFTANKVEQLKQLSQLGLRIAGETSLERLVESAPRMASRITGASLAALVLISKEGEDMDMVGYSDEEDRAVIDRIVQDTDLLPQVLRKRCPPREDGPYEEASS